AVVNGKPVAQIMKDDTEQGLVESKPGVYKWDESINWFARGDQDRVAQESQGPIYDRTKEHLGYTDRGVILLRRLYNEYIEAVHKGLDPLGMVRDPKQNQMISLVPHEVLLD